MAYGRGNLIFTSCGWSIWRSAYPFLRGLNYGLLGPSGFHKNVNKMVIRIITFTGTNAEGSEHSREISYVPESENGFCRDGQDCCRPKRCGKSGSKSTCSRAGTSRDKTAATRRYHDPANPGASGGVWLLIGEEPG